MAKKIAISNLNASTIDIINVIRQNASYEYQSKVPEVKQANDIPKVGETIYGTPAFANEFLNALLNRIALVKVKSATFNNPYAGLKKGYLEFGETVEDIFVQIASVVEFDADKAAAREFKRTFPKVESAFYAMNWRVMYPVTIQDKDLYTAFQSLDGVQNLIAKIVDAIYTAAEYDEFLLFKYLLINDTCTKNLNPACSLTKLTTTSATLEHPAAAKQFRALAEIRIAFMGRSATVSARMLLINARRFCSYSTALYSLMESLHPCCHKSPRNTGSLPAARRSRTAVCSVSMRAL